jgi:hypothetical protein
VSDIIKGLDPAARGPVADQSFRAGEAAAIDAGPYVIEDVGMGREVGLAPLRSVVAHATRRPRPAGSDGWLAPRVHATLRLTRRDAADRRLWAYLGAVALPDYVRWRWRDPDDHTAPVAIDRFVGGATINALSWLWWAAELTRDGGDYGPTERALSGPGFAPAWLGLGVMHHRAAAQAVVACLAGLRGAGGRDERGRAAVRALDLALRSIALDAVAPAVPPDAAAVREWCAGHVDDTLMIHRLPVGPDEPPAAAEDIAAVRTVLDRFVGPGRPARRGRRRAGAGMTRA